MKAEEFEAVAESIKRDTDGAWSLVPTDSTFTTAGGKRRMVRVMGAKLCHRLYPITDMRIQGRDAEWVRVMVTAIVKACFLYEFSLDWDADMPPAEFQAALVKHGLIEGEAQCKPSAQRYH